MTIQKYLAESASAFEAALNDVSLHAGAAQASALINRAFALGHRLFIAGNGGSAADAQHFAAELVGYYSGPSNTPLPALALTTDTSFLTAWGNDKDYADIFARQLAAHAREGDIFAITTSGNSKNILLGLEEAGKRGVHRIGLLGRSGGLAKALCDTALCVPADRTPQIQELHIAVIHAICESIER